MLLAGGASCPPANRQAMHLAVWGMSKCERAFAVLETEPAVGPPHDREPHGPRGPASSSRTMTFRYRPGDAPALQDVSFSVRAGETVASSGPSGAGKTTLASLLLRFADPEAGTMRVGGAGPPPSGSRGSGARSGWCRRTFLFHETVAGNLRLTRPPRPTRPGRRAGVGGSSSVRRGAARRGGHGGQGARVPPVGRRAAADRVARDALLKAAPVPILDGRRNVDVASG
jgi:hypothetical protein